MRSTVVRSTVVVLTLMLLGCSAPVVVETTTTSPQPGSTGSQASGSPSLPTSTILETPSWVGYVLLDTDLVHPIIEFQGGGLSSDEFAHAFHRALASCMQQRGWTYEPSLQRSQVPEPKTVGDLRSLRETYGYGYFTLPPPDNSEAWEVVERNGEYFSSLSPEDKERYRMDQYGENSESPSPGSCEDEAGKATGTPLEDQAIMIELNKLYSAAMRSAENLKARDARKACLSERGYDKDPQDMVFARIEEEVSPELVAFEIAAAMADFECSLTTTMVADNRLETEVVKTLIERYPEWGK